MQTSSATPDDAPDGAPAAKAWAWDPLVRLTHWGVAAAIVANGLITEEGSQFHIWIGYAAGGLLALRLFWALIGPARARFSAFPPSPRRAAGHVRDIAAGRRTTHDSHNPLGALMVYALWATLAVVVGTGIAMAGPPRISTPEPAAASTAGAVQPSAAAPAAARDGDEDGDEGEAGEAAERQAKGEGAEGGEGGEEMIEEVHEVAANLLFVLAALHVAGVAFETRRSGAVVVRRMLGGRRRPDTAA